MGMHKYGDEEFSQYNLNTSEHICSSHISESFIIKTITKTGNRGKCTYCGRTKKVVPLSDILSIIIDGIDYLYEDPGNSRYYNREGLHGYDGDTFDGYDIWRENYLGLEFDDEQVYEDIARYLENDQIYCSKNEYTSYLELLESQWNEFKQIVKHKARFVFYFQGVFNDSFTGDPLEILDQVQHSILKYNLFTEIPINTKLYRTRQHEDRNAIKEASHITSPPGQNAKYNGRMNPAGISMFYCSKDKLLTVAEVVDFESVSKKYYSTAYFKNTETLRLVDLTDIPKTGSIFDSSSNDDIEPLSFLSKFASDISMPIDENDSIIEYIPTQIVTEYIRFNPKLNVEGIIYRSSKLEGKNNIVLFYDHETSLEKLDFFPKSIKTKNI